jgi:alpha-ketoglutarate-dependent taurine dioxygenase
MSSNLDVRPISGSLGAEILGVDLSRNLNQETFAAIHQAFLDHLVIFFRDQDLTVDQQIAFARRFGPLMTDPFVKSSGDHPELLVVVREKTEKRIFGEGWHSDNTFLEKPPLGSFLYAKELPPYGGDTAFANQYLAYEELSPGLRATLDQLRAVHTPASYNKSIAAGRYGADRTMKLRHDAVMDAALVSEIEHPVVRTHPETGRKALYVNAGYTVRFKGWSEEESQPLLKYLYEHATKPELSCRFRWAPGSLALWDNRCVMHKAINDYFGQRRVMHRVVAEGDRPS